MATTATILTDVLDRLTDGIRKLATVEGWTRWLAFQSKFHTYSANNVLLIAAQRPDSTRLAGFHTWRSVGRCVRKGEHGIRIVAPVVARARVKDESGAEDSIAAGVVGWRLATIFDVAQTDGAALPEPPCQRLTDDAPAGAMAALDRVAAAHGWTVEESDQLGSANGLTIPKERGIRIAAGLSPAQRVKTYAHELGHALMGHGEDLRTGQLCRELAETEAESVAYIVCDAMGIASDDYTFAYVSVWSGGTDEAVAAIQASATRIAKVARTILEGAGVAA